jgi:hypothetical protein
VELFVYVAMLRGGMNLAMPTISILSENEDEKSAIRQEWFHFDANKCDCFSQIDKERIFRVLGQYDGGVPAFNDYIQQLARDLFADGDSGDAGVARSGGIPTEDTDQGKPLPALLAPSPASAASKIDKAIQPVAGEDNRV